MEENGSTYDAVVVGLGLFGSSTLYSLTKRNCKVLGIEQFDLGHSRGSSHGHTRIIRRAYETERYAKMVELAYPMWHQLESEANRKLLIPTGGLDVGPTDTQEMRNVINVLEKLKIDHEVMGPEAAHERFPGLFLPDGHTAVFNDQGGILLAGKCVRTYQDCAVKRGAKIIDNTKVVACKDQKGTVTLTLTDGNTIQTKKVVFSTGAWLPPMIEKLFDIKVQAQVLKMGYFYFDTRGSDAYSYKNFPAFVERNGQLHCYGTPAYEYDGLVKVGGHGVVPSAVTSADSRTFIPDDWVKSLSVEFVKKYFKLCNATEPVLQESCLYTWMREEDFVLSAVPHRPNVIVGGGGSGHAFKHGPVIGEMLADLVQDGVLSKRDGLDQKYFSLEKHLITSSKL